MEEKNYVELDIRTRIETKGDPKKNAEDLAWEHAKETAQAVGISMGSDEFADIFKTLADRYDHQLDHMKFFMVTSLVLLRGLLEEEYVYLKPDNGRLTEDEAAKKIGDAAQVIMASLTWFAAGYETTWPSNDELPEELSCKFLFDENDVTITEEN